MRFVIHLLKWLGVAFAVPAVLLLIFWGALVIQSERKFAGALEDAKRIEFDRMDVEWEGESLSGTKTALFLLGGVRTGMKAVRLVEPFPGTLVISAEYPLKRRLPENDIPSKVRSCFSLIDGSAESLVAFALVIRYLEAREEIDSIVLVGASLGVPYTTMLAAQNEVDGLALLYGGGKMGIILERAIDVGPPWFRAVLGAALGRVLAPVDPVRHIGAVSPTPIFLINADHDPHVPDEAVRTLHEAAGEPRKIIIIEGGGHVKPGKTGLLQRARAEVGIWLSEIGVLEFPE